MRNMEEMHSRFVYSLKCFLKTLSTLLSKHFMISLCQSKDLIKLFLWILSPSAVSNVHEVMDDMKRSELN